MRELKNKGIIDKSFKEINLSDFLKDKPNLINNLKKKYGLINQSFINKN